VPSKTAKITYVTLLADESIHPKYEAALERFEKELGKKYPMHIGSKEVWADEEFEHHSPMDTSVIVGRFQVGTRSHAKAAVEAARDAFEGWSATPWRKRVAVMRKVASLIDERKFDIAARITYEVGKNRSEALAECWEAVDVVNLYAGVMESHNGYVEKLGSGGPGEKGKMVAKPLGVWPIVSPFNFPFMLANGMALGALITGNTVVLKPTSEAPLTGLMLYRCYVESGVPRGVVNYVTGPGGNFEEEFTKNPAVAGIAFTGSRDVGMKLYHEFLSDQQYPKPILLEMGSKNPTIVTDRADLEKAVEGTVRSAFGYDGQKCSATSRAYVQSGVYDEFLDGLKRRAKAVVVGDPRRKETFMGPVINEAAVKRFRSAVKAAVSSGGRVLIGGNVLKSGIFREGFYVQPTVIVGLPVNHALFSDEIFLPFVAVAKVRDLEEAIRLANDTPYGLTAGIFSEDVKEVGEFMDRVRFGVVYANRRGGSTTGAWPGAQTFVGWNASGSTGKGIGGPNYLLTFLREQSQTVVD